MNIPQVEVDTRIWDNLRSSQSLLKLVGAVLFEVPKEELDLETPIEKLRRIWLSFKSSGLSQEALSHRVYSRGKVLRLF